MPDTLTITAPDDWHIHLRDDEALKLTVSHAAESFQRAIVMPNLVPPVTNAERAIAYKNRILASVPAGLGFEPLMVLYLTDKTDPKTIVEAHEEGIVACKLYPAGATTNSDSGVTAIENIYLALEAMQECGMKLLVHGEVTSSDIDIFDREARFIDTIMSPKIIENFPELKVVFEHITTKDAADFVKSANRNLAATITAHHLLYNRNHMLAGGIRPHYYCLPILKRNTHQTALIDAATSGNPKFFLGTDSAPHTKNKKEASCGCAGAYTAHAPLSLYAEAFELAGALEKLEGFASHFGPDFYGLKRNSHTVTLVKSPWTVPESFEYLDETLVPIKAGEQLNWRVKSFG